MAGQIALPSLFMDHCWILIGMMGAGKSSVGRALAELSGRNFVDTISEVARAGGELKVVDDQVGRPTWTRSLAQTIAELVERRQTGTFHASDGGTPVSWCEFAREIVERQGLPARISPVSSEANPKPARRPLYSVLDCSDTEAVVGYRMPDWKAMLGRYLAEKTASDGAAMGTVAGG